MKLEENKNHWKNPWKQGDFSIWCDTEGQMRVKNGIPEFEKDGNLVVSALNVGNE